MEAGKLELALRPVNLKQFLHNLISPFSAQAANKQLEFSLNIDGSLDTEFVTDETRLNQVLSNLLSNAIKFTHEGSIAFSVKRLFSSSQKATVQFIVEDSGIGIAKEKHREIFGSFTQADVNTTRKYGGTGLGLAISKSLVNMFNSELMLESEPGKGSRFHFTIEFQVNENRKLYIHEDSNHSLASLEGIRVLIAEDNKANLSIAKRFLTNWGIEVTEALNGKEAVERFLEGKFDVMLIDLEMPEMDGASALREIRKHNQLVPAIAFTAAVYDNMQLELLEKGFSDYIHKPFRPKDLHTKIEMQLHKNLRQMLQ
jgi:CheY-like chemotaxis protein